ncbi:MAG: hypothetical protein OEW80_02665 [Gemmatimonadota bacterium]|nr:hypothetical protein [Gemmatimonadota bacterium]
MGTTLRAQVSPGPLARAHQSLEGALKCTSCHGGGKAGMSGRCAACHKDIGQLTGQRKGYHGSSTVRDTPCAACHPDHAGLSFGMVKWPGGSQVRFDHRQSGWALEQSHDSLACEKCHASKYRTAPEAALSVRKSDAGWVGLGTTCASCHADPHRDALGTGCTECHDASSWEAAPRFNHDSTSYPLTERHRQVKCAECHESPRVAKVRTAQGAVIPVFKPLQYEACSNCHTDPHAGQLGPKCAECHTTAGFTTVAPGRFSHDRTRYRLTGRHARVACAACHGKFRTAVEKRPAFQSCTSCHREAHNGTATLAGQVVDCGACHTPAGFAVGTTTVAQHARTRYSLEGRHASVTCAKCHRRDPAGKARWGTSGVVLRPAAARCEDCHADTHGTQLAAFTPRPACADCHAVAGWAPSSFGPAAHARLRLALDGRHVEVTCRACHAKDRKGLPPLPASAPSDRVGFLFRIPEVTCTGCHQDPHGGRIASASARVQKEGCLACHDTRAFRPSSAGPATHAEFGFPLDGAHGATPCVGCHAEMKAAPQARRSSLAAAAGLPSIRFSAKRECAACHKTIHGSQFSNRPDGGRCDACHDTGGFAPASRFDHTRDASFSTKGAHAAVPCAKCHSPDPASGDKRGLIYRPVSAKCESCHAGSEAR